MKPDFNDIVIHRGYCYGFDNAIFGCLDLKDGAQKWAVGRYGKGQVLLLAESDLLLVLSEKGELVLLRASPESFQELAKIQAMEGKTWNHPVVVGDMVPRLCLGTQYRAGSACRIAKHSCSILYAKRGRASGAVRSQAEPGNANLNWWRSPRSVK